MNVNQTDLLFQMMAMASQAAQASLPSTGSTGETGKSDFQSLLEDKRTENSQTAERPEKGEDPSRPEDGQTQKPEDGQTAEQPEGQEPAAESWKLGLLAYAGQLSFAPEMAAEVPAEGQIVQPAAVVPEGEAAPAAPVAELPVEQAAAMPVQAEQAAVQTAAPVQAEAVPAQPETATVQTPEAAEPAPAEPAVQEAPKAESGRNTQAQADTDSQPDGGAQTGEPQAEAQVESWQRPLFREVEHMPVKVGDNAALDTAAPEFDNRLANTLDTALADGAQRLELKLSPENLGNVVVEMTRSPDGALHIVLRAESEQAAKLLNDHSGSLGLLLQSSTQSEVRVEVPQPQQSEQQPWKQPDQNGGQQQGGDSQPQRQHREEQNTDDFLSQLRLGLLETAAE